MHGSGGPPVAAEPSAPALIVAYAASGDRNSAEQLLAQYD